MKWILIKSSLLVTRILPFIRRFKSVSKKKGIAAAAASVKPLQKNQTPTTKIPKQISTTKKDPKEKKKSKMDKILNKVPNQAPDGPLGTDKKGPSLPSPIPYPPNSSLSLPHTNPPKKAPSPPSATHSETSSPTRSRLSDT